jgi:hypothetical protein
MLNLLARCGAIFLIEYWDNDRSDFGKFPQIFSIVGEKISVIDVNSNPDNVLRGSKIASRARKTRKLINFSSQRSETISQHMGARGRCPISKLWEGVSAFIIQQYFLMYAQRSPGPFESDVFACRFGFASDIMSNATTPRVICILIPMGGCPCLQYSSADNLNCSTAQFTSGLGRFTYEDLIKIAEDPHLIEEENQSFS